MSSPTQPRHDDIIIRRRFGKQPVTHAVKQIYAVTDPGHTDQGAERDHYCEAEEVALRLAEELRFGVVRGESSERQENARKEFQGLRLSGETADLPVQLCTHRA